MPHLAAAVYIENQNHRIDGLPLTHACVRLSLLPIAFRDARPYCVHHALMVPRHLPTPYTLAMCASPPAHLAVSRG